MTSAFDLVGEDLLFRFLNPAPQTEFARESSFDDAFTTLFNALEGLDDPRVVEHSIGFGSAVDAVVALIPDTRVRVSLKALIETTGLKNAELQSINGWSAEFFERFSNGHLLQDLRRYLLTLLFGFKVKQTAAKNVRDWYNRPDEDEDGWIRSRGQLDENDRAAFYILNGIQVSSEFMIKMSDRTDIGPDSVYAKLPQRAAYKVIVATDEQLGKLVNRYFKHHPGLGRLDPFPVTPDFVHEHLESELDRLTAAQDNFPFFDFEMGLSVASLATASIVDEDILVVDLADNAANLDLGEELSKQLAANLVLGRNFSVHDPAKWGERPPWLPWTVQYFWPPADFLNVNDDQEDPFVDFEVQSVHKKLTLCPFDIQVWTYDKFDDNDSRYLTIAFRCDHQLKMLLTADCYNKLELKLLLRKDKAMRLRALERLFALLCVDARLDATGEYANRNLFELALDHLNEREKGPKPPKTPPIGKNKMKIYEVFFGKEVVDRYGFTSREKPKFSELFKIPDGVSSFLRSHQDTFETIYRQLSEDPDAVIPLPANFQCDVKTDLAKIEIYKQSVAQTLIMHSHELGMDYKELVQLRIYKSWQRRQSSADLIAELVFANAAKHGEGSPQARFGTPVRQCSHCKSESAK